MNVTRDVILDLLPMYFAGQASQDTRTLVDDFLHRDPDFARMSERFDTLLKERGGDAPAAPDITERRALEKTRALLRRRNQWIGMAAGYSLAPFMFVFGDGRIDFVLWHRPVVAVTFGLVGVACWVVAFVLQWRAKGVQPGITSQ